ncbi:MAG: antibiotic biosynthesis monooxygenase [Alphaproteobacteria bacterium]|nr:antibiotic biosynthesis monooxygenase [Alphaproteobacteria bacterium]
MAIAVVATLKVAQGKEAEFEGVFRELSAQVRANEPGNKLYQLCRSKADSSVYVVMEMYADDAALKAHGASEHFKAAGPKLGPCLAGRPEIQYFETV